MIYSALLVPYESPNSLREIRRALLTYDKVLLVDPSDRDIIPANSFLSTIIGIPLLNMNTGPVRPMGKSLGYDARFEKTLDYCAEAVGQGLIEVQSTYQAKPVGQMMIGAVHMGGYPLNTRFVFSSYRAMAADSGFLQSSIQDDTASLLTQLELCPEIAPKGVGDGGINNIPPLPPIPDKIADAQNEGLAIIARSRIGAFIKYAGYCEAKELVPVFPSEVYGGIAKKILNNAVNTLSSADEQGELLRAGRVMELCHEEFLDDRKLDMLSITDVLKLRSAAWGKQAAAREQLFE